MRMLSFFPWLQITEKKNFGDFEIFPYSRNDSTGTFSEEEKQVIEQITSPYLLHKDSPIQNFTLLRHKNSSLTEEMDESLRDQAFLFSELLAFSGLSVREFFCHGNYCNRDNFSLIIQGFDRADQGAAITSRRRDGSGTNYWTQDSYQVQKPDHVRCHGSVNIDEELLNSLIVSIDSKQWETISEAVIFFNLANKDGNEIRDIIEIILLVSAFERLISPKMGDEHALAQAFSSLLIPKKNLELSECERLAAIPKDRFKNSSTVRDIWIRDIFRVRGNHAHGRMNSPYPALWSIENHLLLGAFIFPLILKLFLEKLSFYELSDDDKDSIEAFEILACAEHFQELPEEMSRGDAMSHPWTQITRKVSRDQTWERIAEKVEKLYPE